MSQRDIPLIKEYKIDRMKECMKCIQKHPYDREAQRDCILLQYDSKSEKSVFRGMLIPSLRDLGLIVGYGDYIRLSANAEIIVRSEPDDKLHKTVLKVVMYDIDTSEFGFLSEIQKSASLSQGDFTANMCSKIRGPSEKQKRERITRWLKILRQVELITVSDDHLSISRATLDEIQANSAVNAWKQEEFAKYLLETYRNMVDYSEQIVDIATLREKLAVKFLEEKQILTERQFDEALKRIPISTADYMISLGRPMGTEEKLFQYEGKYFGTLSIRFTRKEEHEDRTK